MKRGLKLRNILNGLGLIAQTSTTEVITTLSTMITLVLLRNIA